MRLNLGDVLEFVAAAAVGMALARSVHDLKGTTQYDFFTCLEFVSAFMAGISLVMGLRLWFEARRPQEYRVWGIGRWTWSLCASSIVLHVALRAVSAPLIMYRRNHRIIMHNEWGTIFWTSVLWPMEAFPELLLAFLITARIARWPRDPAPDYREWTGRAFAGLLVIRYAVLELSMILQ
jgi:hypothetical protein